MSPLERNSSGKLDQSPKKKRIRLLAIISITYSKYQVIKTMVGDGLSAYWFVFWLFTTYHYITIINLFFNSIPFFNLIINILRNMNC